MSSRSLQKTNARTCMVWYSNGLDNKKFQSDIIARVGLFMRWTISQSVRIIVNDMYYIVDRGNTF